MGKDFDTVVNLESENGDVEKIFLLSQVRRILEADDRGCSAVAKREGGGFFYLCKDGEAREIEVRFPCGPPSRETMQVIVPSSERHLLDRISSFIERKPLLSLRPAGTTSVHAWWTVSGEMA